MTLTAVSLFAGVGGFDLALQRAGVQVTAAVEIDPAARGVLADHFPHTRLYEDVTRVHAYKSCLSDPALRQHTEEQQQPHYRGSDADRVGEGACPGCLPDIDPSRTVLTGGFPCQDLSVAGHRAGLGGARSGLFWEIDRLLAELRPRWVLLENVPGLLSSHDGRDMGAVLRALGQRGYGVAYRVLDAQHFGVPQRRRRVFIAGCLGDWAAPAQVLLEPESGGGGPAPRRRSGEGVAAATGGGVADGRRSLTSPTVTSKWAKGSGGPAGDEAQNLLTFQKVVRSGERDTAGELPPEVWAARDVASTLNPHDLTSGTRAVDVVVEPVVRRLTPTECERLQGFPDGWTATSHGRPQADSARYRQMGNAVAVPVVEWIVRRIVTGARRNAA